MFPEDERRAYWQVKREQEAGASPPADGAETAARFALWTHWLAGLVDDGHVARICGEKVARRAISILDGPTSPATARAARSVVLYVWDRQWAERREPGTPTFDEQETPR